MNVRVAFGAAILGFGAAALALSGAGQGVAQGRMGSVLADPCATPPEPVSAAVAREPGWSLLRLDNLQSDDRALWNGRRPKACPGFASARLGVGSGPAYAVALLRTTRPGTEEKVVLLIPDAGRIQERLLARPHTVSNPEVVWRAGPGKTRAWDGGPAIDVAHDSIIVETIEASAEQFFFVHGRMRTVVTSD